MEFLTPHFSLEELIASQAAARFDFDNTPSPAVVARLLVLCETILEPARLDLGPLYISSGYRSPTVNAFVRGSKHSAHMTGDAADVIPLHVSKHAFASWVSRNCPFDQIILEFGTRSEPAWIHVSSAPPLRGQILRILPETGYELVSDL